METKTEKCERIATNARDICKSLAETTIKIPFLGSAAGNLAGKICYKTAGFICDKVVK